jgi:DNA-binding MarR family transcriptional regulator
MQAEDGVSGPPVSPSGSPSAGQRSEDALSHELIRNSRLMHVLRGQLASTAPAGLDYSSFGLLMTLNKCGAKRQGELADLAMLDPSTVSRYISQLVRAGLVERRADPADGRAVQLQATPAGEEVGRQLVQRRQGLVREVMSGWDEESKRTLCTLLRRLNDDLEAHRPFLLPGTSLPRTASSD